MQIHHHADGQRARRPHVRAVFCGLVAALACGAFGASAAQASDDFGSSFEAQLGRSLARNLAHVMFDIHRPHHVRYVPAFYASDHRAHRSRGRHHESHHARAHHARHIHHSGCEHRISHHREHRERYVHHEMRFDHSSDRHRRDDRPRRGRHF